MKKLIGAVLVALMFCTGCLFVACSDEPETQTQGPLTVTDCFKDFVGINYFKSSNKPQGWENQVGTYENVSLSDLLKSENDITSSQYSYFLIYTTEKAASIEVTSISFEIVTATSCQVQFCLGYSVSDTVYSNSVAVEPETVATVTFSSLNKRWSTADAGKSELISNQEGDKASMLGEASTYLKIELINKTDFLEEGYRIQNLKINFEEF